MKYYKWTYKHNPLIKEYYKVDDDGRFQYYPCNDDGGITGWSPYEFCKWNVYCEDRPDTIFVEIPEEEMFLEML